MRKLYCVLLFATLTCAAGTVTHKQDRFVSNERKVVVDIYGLEDQAPTTAIILLYGSGGMHSSHFPIDQQARFFAGSGRLVYLPHYLDLTKDSADKPEAHYSQWAQAVLDLSDFVRREKTIPMSRMAIIGYSLGGSVALSAGTLNPDFADIVSWSGSLPDVYVSAQRLPPLLILHGSQDAIIPDFNARQLKQLCSLRGFSCKLSLYADEGHRFSSTARERADREISRFLDDVLGH